MNPIPMVYVGAPYTAPDRAGVERNIRRAETLGIEVAKLGAFPVIPHSMTSAPEFDRVQPYSFWIAGTLCLLRPCDAMIAGPRWEYSKGTIGEIAEMRRLGKPVFFSLDELADWLATRSATPEAAQ